MQVLKVPESKRFKYRFADVPVSCLYLGRLKTMSQRYPNSWDAVPGSACMITNSRENISRFVSDT